MGDTIDSRQVVRVKTRRGVLTIGPYGKLNGLWEIVRRELLTNEEVRKLCGRSLARARSESTRGAIIVRSTLIRWRANGFPPPVLTIKTPGGTVELWSKSDVETWLAQRDN